MRALPISYMVLVRRELLGAFSALCDRSGTLVPVDAFTPRGCVERELPD